MELRCDIWPMMRNVFFFLAWDCCKKMDSSLLSLPACSLFSCAFNANDDERGNAGETNFFFSLFLFKFNGASSCVHKGQACADDVLYCTISWQKEGRGLHKKMGDVMGWIVVRFTCLLSSSSQVSSFVVLYVLRLICFKRRWWIYESEWETFIIIIFKHTLFKSLHHLPHLSCEALFFNFSYAIYFVVQYNMHFCERRKVWEW